MTGRALIVRIPDIGELFTITDSWASRRYRVDGWMKRASPPPTPKSLYKGILTAVLYGTSRKLGPDRVLLQWCRRDEAEYITGCGVSGCIKRVRDVVVDGKVSWPEWVIEQERRSALRLVGEILF